MNNTLQWYMSPLRAEQLARLRESLTDKVYQIALLRVADNLSQQEVARSAGVSQPTVSRALAEVERLFGCRIPRRSRVRRRKTVAESEAHAVIDAYQNN